MRAILQQFNTTKQQLHWMKKHLIQQHPKRRLHEQAQRLDLCELNLKHLITTRITKYQNQLANAASKLDALSR